MSSRLISKYFPVPKYLQPQHIGVSFSDQSIKAIAFDRSASRPNPKGVIIPLLPGAIESGAIINVDEVVKALLVVKEVLDQPFVFFAVPDELAYVFTVSVPVSSHDATESVAFTIEENVPLSLGDVAFDFLPLSTNGGQAKMVVAATAKSGIEKFIEAFNKAGMDTVGCIHESQAVANAIVSKDFLGTVYIVHAKQNRLGIYLVKDGVVCFSTLRKIAGGDYAEQTKDEYMKFLEYCAKYGVAENNAVPKVFICGDFEYAQKAMEVLKGLNDGEKEITLSNVWSNVSVAQNHTMPNISYEDSLSLSGPIGAVLAHVI